MKLREFNILECLPEVVTDQFDFKGVYEDQDGDTHNLTIFDSVYFLTHLYQLHATRKIMSNEDNPSGHFITLFNCWAESRLPLYLRQAYAYTLKYNPIENYSSREDLIGDITTHEKDTQTERTFDNTDLTTLTPFTKETTETTPYTKETTETTPYTKETTETTPYTKETTETTPYDKETTETTPYDKETTETTPTNYANTHSKKAFDSTNWSETDRDVRSGSEKVEHTKTGTEKVEEYKTGTEKVEFSKTGTEKVEFSKTGTEKVEFSKTGTEKTEHTFTGTQENQIDHSGTITDANTGTDTDTRNYTLLKSGNIGVQTAAEMLQKEYDGLIQDLAYRAYSEFIDRFTYYAEGVI